MQKIKINVDSVTSGGNKSKCSGINRVVTYYLFIFNNKFLFVAYIYIYRIKNDRKWCFFDIFKSQIIIWYDFLLVYLDFFELVSCRSVNKVEIIFVCHSANVLRFQLFSCCFPSASFTIFELQERNVFWMQQTQQHMTTSKLLHPSTTFSLIK